jgi:hypothetical protein
MTLVEVVICTLLVAVVLLGAMNMLGSVVRDRTYTADTARAQHMAQQLMTEILRTDYEEQGAGGLLDGILASLGLEIGESASNRATFDDVDDFHGWDASPPKNRDGTAMANSTGWRHTVAVQFANPSTPSATIGTDSGVKRVTVTIYQGTTVAARLVALRSDVYTP